MPYAPPILSHADAHLIAHVALPTSEPITAHAHRDMLLFSRLREEIDCAKMWIDRDVEVHGPARASKSAVSRHWAAGKIRSMATLHHDHNCVYAFRRGAKEHGTTVSTALDRGRGGNGRQRGSQRPCFGLGLLCRSMTCCARRSFGCLSSILPSLCTAFRRPCPWSCS